jgi:hypothetical protein
MVRIANVFIHSLCTSLFNSVQSLPIHARLQMCKLMRPPCPLEADTYLLVISEALSLEPGAGNSGFNSQFCFFALILLYYIFLAASLAAWQCQPWLHPSISFGNFKLTFLPSQQCFLMIHHSRYDCCDYTFAFELMLNRFALISDSPSRCGRDWVYAESLCVWGNCHSILCKSNLHVIYSFSSQTDLFVLQRMNI